MKSIYYKLFFILTVLCLQNTYLLAQSSKGSTKSNAKKPATASTKLPPNTSVFYIDAERAKCEGVTTMQCLMVKKQGQKEYELFYDNIEGFNYEEGYTYTIWVREELKSPPIAADESLFKYVYVKTVSKKSVNPSASTTNASSTSSTPSLPKQTANLMKQVVLVVNEEKAPCEGNPDAQCLMIKQQGKKEYEIFYQPIDGFTHEQGFRQTILVKERPVDNPMVKQTVPIYTLIKVIKKEKIGGGVPVKTNPVKSTVVNDLPINAITKVLEVNYETTACEADPKVQCLLVKERGSSNFEIFKHKIDGFNFEPGYHYTIAVQENEIGQYKLVSLIDKTKNDPTAVAPPKEAVAEIVTLSVLDKKWIIREIRDSDSSILAIEDDNLSVKFNTVDKRFNGKAPCNTYFGELESDLKASFKASNIGSTKMYCDNMKLEMLLFEQLQNADNFVVKNGILKLMKGNKMLLKLE